MTITDEQLKGNWAEQYVASQLASCGCLVRHVMQGHDSGVDLYCEKVKDGIAYLHFWCQIKCSSKWKGKAKSIKFNGRKKHIEYWVKQPAPVFIFLVPDIRKKDSLPYYICRSLDFLFKKKQSIRSLWKIDSIEDLKQFLEIQLIFESYLWDLNGGKVSYLKYPKEEYTKLFPLGYSVIFEPKLKQSIRWTLYRLAFDHIFLRDDPNRILSKSSQPKSFFDRKMKAEPYLKALEAFILGTNDEHNENYELIGAHYELGKEFEKAKSYYLRALQSLYNDPVIDKNSPPWEDIIRRVNNHVERIQDKNPASKSSN